MRQHRRRGVPFVLGFSLIAISFVLTIAGIAEVRSTMAAAHSEVEWARARTIADAAVRLAILRVLYPVPEQAHLLDGRDHDMSFDGAALRIRFEPEGDPADIDACTFIVIAEARLPSGGHFIRTATVDLTGDPGAPYRVLNWDEGAFAGRRPGGGKLTPARMAVTSPASFSVSN